MNSRLEEMKSKLIELKQNYQKYILKGHEDPYQYLMKDKEKKIIVGPKNSNLFALVKIRSSHKNKSYYRNQANRLINSIEIIKEIEEKFCNYSDSFIVSSTNKKNPYFIRENGEIEKLEWHHSPNHIMTVSLIPASLHRATGIKKKIHYDGARGGNDMYIEKLIKGISSR